MIVQDDLSSLRQPALCHLCECLCPISPFSLSISLLAAPLPELFPFDRGNLSVKRSTLYARAESGEISSYKIGRLIRFKKDEVEKWMENHRRERVDTDIGVKRILKATTRPRMNMDSLISDFRRVLTVT